MFYGREEYLEKLGWLMDKPLASVVTCRGRRRVGKSTLFEEFSRRNQCRFIKIEGLTPSEGISDREQREAFGRQLALQSSLPELTPTSWTQAFSLLNSVIPDDGRWTVVLLDEISWMGGKAKSFPGELKIAWDNLFKKHDRLILVVCGSVSSWITENIIKSTGFLGRRSLDFVLPELPLKDAVRFWDQVRAHREPREILDLLSVVGGVPRYLEEMNFSLTLDENLRRTMFNPEGYLFKDFGDIFDRVFGRRASRKRGILEALAEGPRTVSEIARAVGLQRNGYFTKDLKELDASGFVAEERGINPETGEPALETRYRIKDAYTRFYLRYVFPERERIARGLFPRFNTDLLEDWDGLMGRQFETLVCNNLHALLPRLGLEHAEIHSAAPYFRRGRKGEGCQIDLLIQTDVSAYVVEIKRQRRIGMEVVDQINREVSRLPLRKGLSVRTAFVYSGALDESVIRRHPVDFLVNAADMIA